MKQIKTARNYDLFETVSAVQKAIRRNKPKLAAYFGMEMFSSGFDNFLWKRLLTISAEDCGGIITKEIWALYQAYNYINKNQKKHKNQKKPRGRIFVTKAILLLSEQPKNRDSDHFNNYVYDKHKDITEQEINDFLATIDETDRVEIPDYALDNHTIRGKKMGRTKEAFMRNEQKALDPKQTSLFGHLAGSDDR